MTPIAQLSGSTACLCRPGAAGPVRPGPGRPAPRRGPPAQLPPEAERRLAAGLMRVNHAGEIAAQGLYHGQALVARDPAIRHLLEQAGREETDHLAWCEERLRELQDRPSLLDPLWYAGSFAIGVVAGLASDRVSLGFVAETERQVEAAPGHAPGAAARRRPAQPGDPHADADRRNRAWRPGAAVRRRIDLPAPVRTADAGDRPGDDRRRRAGSSATRVTGGQLVATAARYVIPTRHRQQDRQ